MSYIRDLRNLPGVGHRPLIMVTGGVFLFDSKGRVLLIRRSDDGSYGVPAGAMEPGETVEEAARRECLEETGISCGVLELHSVISGEDAHFTYPNGDEVYAVDFNYVCLNYTGTLKMQSDEVTELDFFDPHQLPLQLNKNDRRIIEEIIQHEGVKFEN